MCNFENQGRVCKVCHKRKPILGSRMLNGRQHCKDCYNQALGRKPHLMMPKAQTVPMK